MSNCVISIFVSQYVAMCLAFFQATLFGADTGTGKMSGIHIYFNSFSNMYRPSIFYSQLCYVYYISHYIYIFTALQHVPNPPGIIAAVLGIPVAGGGCHQAVFDEGKSLIQLYSFSQK